MSVVGRIVDDLFLPDSGDYTDIVLHSEVFYRRPDLVFPLGVGIDDSLADYPPPSYGCIVDGYLYLTLLRKSRLDCVMSDCWNRVAVRQLVFPYGTVVSNRGHIAPDYLFSTPLARISLPSVEISPHTWVDPRTEINLLLTQFAKPKSSSC